MDNKKEQELEAQTPEKVNENKVADKPKQDKPIEAPEKESQNEQEPEQDKKDVITKEQYESVRGDVSAKSKQISSLQAKIQQIENREAVKDLLLESSLPGTVKAKLKASIDNLTPDNFQEKANDLLEVYNAGLESYKTKQTEEITKLPEKAQAKDFDIKINEVKNAKELQALVDEQKRK